MPPFLHLYEGGHDPCSLFLSVGAGCLRVAVPLSAPTMPVRISLGFSRSIPGIIAARVVVSRTAFVQSSRIRNSQDIVREYGLHSNRGSLCGKPHTCQQRQYPQRPHWNVCYTRPLVSTQCLRSATYLYCHRNLSS